MSRILWIAVAFAALFRPGAAVSQQTPEAAPSQRAGTEMLVLTPPKDWRLAFRERRDDMFVVQYTPPETMGDDWRDMVQAQVFLGVTGLAPEAYLDQLLEFYARACAPIGAGATDVGDVAGYPFASKVLLCGRNRETGRGSVILFKVIRGREALYAVTRAWRGAAFDLDRAPISQGELADWAYYLAGARLCDLASAETPCRAP